jgi:hypothetical protein
MLNNVIWKITMGVNNESGRAAAYYEILSHYLHGVTDVYPIQKSLPLDQYLFQEGTSRTDATEHMQVTSCCNLPVPCQEVKVHECLFHKSNKCSMSNTTWHLILIKLARMRLRIHFPILLWKTNPQHTIFELFLWHRKCAGQKPFKSPFGVKWW